ncbi:hypothetical protein VMCG_02549 [Cytospora schulzeri]|uniref:Uncharacterized protein n=1 Tax=Cytospora schulzeri TaxID=448051 RepID=A0A423X0N1_9PEZI|nr:hypothetical protein VMCG_02549 [Valsa malicola]
MRSKYVTPRLEELVRSIHAPVRGDDAREPAGRRRGRRGPGGRGVVAGDGGGEGGADLGLGPRDAASASGAGTGGGDGGGPIVVIVNANVMIIIIIGIRRHNDRREGRVPVDEVNPQVVALRAAEVVLEVLHQLVRLGPHVAPGDGVVGGEEAQLDVGEDEEAGPGAEGGRRGVVLDHLQHAAVGRGLDVDLDIVHGPVPACALDLDGHPEVVVAVVDDLGVGRDSYFGHEYGAGNLFVLVPGNPYWTVRVTREEGV